MIWWTVAALVNEMEVGSPVTLPNGNILFTVYMFRGTSSEVLSGHLYAENAETLTSAEGNWPSDKPLPAGDMTRDIERFFAWRFRGPDRKNDKTYPWGVDRRAMNQGEALEFLANAIRSERGYEEAGPPNLINPVYGSSLDKYWDEIQANAKLGLAGRLALMRVRGGYKGDDGIRRIGADLEIVDAMVDNDFQRVQDFKQKYVHHYGRAYLEMKMVLTEQLVRKYLEPGRLP